VAQVAAARIGFPTSVIFTALSPSKKTAFRQDAAGAQSPPRTPGLGARNRFGRRPLQSGRSRLQSHSTE
jgi:hypothetical protein